MELGVDSLCMLTLGTGVGNGIILDGKLWHGATGMGGEAGHMTIEPDGPVCGCGNSGCLEVLLPRSARGECSRAEDCRGQSAALGATQRQWHFLLPPSVWRRPHGRAIRTRSKSTGKPGEPSASDWLASSTSLTCRFMWLAEELRNPGTSYRHPCLKNSSAAVMSMLMLCAFGRPASGGMPGGGTRVLPAPLGPGGRPSPVRAFFQRTCREASLTSPSPLITRSERT